MGNYNTSLRLLFLFLSFFLLNCSAQSTNPVLQRACKDASTSSPNIKYDFCVSSIESHPMSQDAESLAQLYLISIILAEKNAINIISYIEKLLANETAVGYVRSCVDTCAEVYSPVISLLQDARNAFKSNNYATAKASLSSAITIPDSCEQLFAEGEIAAESLLAKEDATFHQMAAVSRLS